MSITPKTLKGFRDFLPNEARKRNYVIETLRRVFESYGFEPLETPSLEYEEILAGKYGEEGDKLMYKFKDRGDRNVALRYDQTVPLARVVAQYQNALPFPFKRYQIQNVWRAENTQKGRFREFLQCDIDIVGSTSIIADAEILEVASTALRKLGFRKFKILINDRRLLGKLNEQGYLTAEELLSVYRSLDKIKKISREGVEKELADKGFSKEIIEAIFSNAEIIKENDNIVQIRKYLKQQGLEDIILFDPMLVRGLDYYTSTIIEVEIEEYSAGSVGGGGRYDNLIGMFNDQTIPAVGFAFGFDRLIEAMDELNLFPQDLNPTKILVTIFSKEYASNSLAIAKELRFKKINTELYPDENAKLEKQLKYADKKGIKYAAILGPEEIKDNKVIIKNLTDRTQVTVSKEDVQTALESLK